MKGLFKFEFRKVFHSKYLYILAGAAILYVLLNGLTIYFVNWIVQNLAEEAGEVLPPDMFANTSYAYTKSALNGNFMMILGLFIAIFACEDNSHATSKNIVGKGFNRTEIFFSKYLVSLLITIVISIVAVVVAALFGLVAWGPDSFQKLDDNVGIIILGELLCVIVYHALFFMIAYSVGKIGAAIVINLLAPLGLGLVLNIVDIVINNEDVVISSYWISGILTNFGSTQTNEKLFALSFVLLFVYLGASVLLGVFFARKKQY